MHSPPAGGGRQAASGLGATPLALGEAGEARLHPVTVAAAAAARAAIRRERIGCTSTRLTGIPRRGYPGVGVATPVDEPAQARGHRLPEGIEVITALQDPGRTAPRLSAEIPPPGRQRGA